MNTENNVIRQVVGLDAHSRKLEFSIWNVTKDFEMDKSKPSKTISGEIQSLESIIKEHTIEGAEIVFEASTNSFAISERINKLGREAVVVKSDTVKNYSPQYKVTDKTDAANLARARIAGLATRVYIPSNKEQAYRTIVHAYIGATKDSVRLSNRIWGFCSENFLPLHRNLSMAAADRLLEEAHDVLDDTRCWILTDLIWRYKNALATELHYNEMISNIVMHEPMMLKLLQVLGVGPVIAFTMVAYIGDIKRFATPKRLCAYIGVVPSINASGERESKNHRLARSGIPIVKAMLAQGAQAALRNGKLPIHTWARHIAARRQCHNIAVMALARKMVMYIWHIMMGHPITYKEMPNGIETKTYKIASKIGQERRTKLGYKTVKELSEAMVNQIMSNIVVKVVETNPPAS